MAEHGASVACPSCGKGLRWKAELAGRKVKCACGHVFAMPAEPKEAAPIAAKAVASPPPAPPRRPAPAPTVLDDGAFELDLPASKPVAPAKAAGKCSSCGAAMKPGAVLCVQCGFNAATGTKVAMGPMAAGAAAGGVAPPRIRSGRLPPEEAPDHRFTELYLPVALIVLGLMITVVRAYSGMGSLTSAEEVDPDDASGGDGDAIILPMDDRAWDDDETMDDKDGDEDDVEPGKEGGPTREAAAKDAKVPDVKNSEIEPAPTKRTARPPPPPKSFSVSPLLVAGFSVIFQLVIMVPVVLGCVLFVAKYVDVSFGSLTSVLLKVTAVVLGPMAMADWIDDIIFSATLGIGGMLAWSIRIVLVGASLIKLFDLDFFEAGVLLVVITFVRFMLSMLLFFLLMSMFIS